MPSASAKVEKVAPSEATDPVKQFIIMLEKKLRNLEKRKMKLDNYRSDVQNGKELNEDQKMAVSKYDSVLSVLEFAKDLSKSMSTIVSESIRQQKKQAKKEQLERQQHEIQRLQESFIYCHILSCFQNEDVRSDFLNGENGAVQLTSEQLSQLDQLYKLIGPGLPNEQADITNHFHVLAENHIFLVEGKNKEIAGTTYKVLKELLYNIKESGYFSRPSEALEDGVSSDEMPEDEMEKLNSKENSVAPEEAGENNPESDGQFEIIDDNTELSASDPVEEETVVESVPCAPNGPLQEVLSPQSTFNFLQESQIDLDAPHMDPAVVAVHQMAPPLSANFTMNPYPVMPPVDDDVTPLLTNGTDPELTVSSQPVVNQVPILQAGLSRSVAPVVNSHHDFDPSHPIPTQTFTNQSFAVMQNMIVPQAYVPVTMHHGPLPHMTPIAVVQGPAVTSNTASAVPIHVPATPVTLHDSGVPNAPEPTVENDEAELNNGDDSIPDVEPVSSDVQLEKGNESNGYAPYRGGYRGRGRGRGNNGYFRGRSNYHNGRGNYQNHYYQDRNQYNGNYRRGNNNRDFSFSGLRGAGGNGRGRNNYRTQPSQSQNQPQQQQQTQQ